MAKTVDPLPERSTPVAPHRLRFSANISNSGYLRNTVGSSALKRFPLAAAMSPRLNAASILVNSVAREVKEDPPTEFREAAYRS
jgi:hypothetical protein